MSVKDNTFDGFAGYLAHIIHNVLKQSRYSIIAFSPANPPEAEILGPLCGPPRNPESFRDKAALIQHLL